MPRVPFGRLAAAGLVAAVLLGASTAAARADEAPRLVVFISIDQMRGDYITRYGTQWTRGLKRLVDDGALWVQAAYPYFNTVTCAGHATMGTGTFPSTHGMVLNHWFDRQTGKTVTCTDDPSESLIVYGAGLSAPTAASTAAAPASAAAAARAGAGAGAAAAAGTGAGAGAGGGGGGIGHSARLLRASTFADELRGQATRAPRVVSLSLKPRSAITLAGHGGDVVLWLDGGSAGWASSTAFGKGKIPFVEKFIAAHPVSAELGTAWTKLLPEGSYFYADDGVGEQPGRGWTRTFPHPVRLDASEAERASAVRWALTPFTDAYLGQFAIAALDEFKLGQAAGTDYLAVSFSALDIVGHAFGPRSHEVQDTLARLDRTIGDLLAALDAKVGAGRYVIALTGDHGVAPIPEQMKAMGIDAGRVDLKLVTSAAEQALVGKFGPKADGGNYVANVSYTDLYFSPGVIEKLKAEPAALQLVVDAIAHVDGVQRVLPAHELRNGLATDDRIMQAVRLSYAPDRSGDLFILPKPYWLMSTAGTTHGTGYFYDERVPVLLYGAGIKPGNYWNAATPADLAPTLAALCGITMAQSDGRVLSEALAPRATMTVPPTARQATP